MRHLTSRAGFLGASGSLLAGAAGLSTSTNQAAAVIDTTAIETHVAKFRNGSPNIAKAFDETIKVLHQLDAAQTATGELLNDEIIARQQLAERVALLEGGSQPPPPPPPFPPTWAQFSDDFNPAPESRPASIPGWQWEYQGSATSFPNPGAAVVDDGLGGKALRLTIPAGVGGNGILSACYEPSGAWGSQGKHQLGQVYVRLVPGFDIAAGSYQWVIVWHENQSWRDINSCAIGLTDDLRLKFQISGGDVTTHAYTILEDNESLQLNRWYLIEWDHVWSGYTDGRFSVKLDGRQICDVNRPTLLRSGTATDITVVGLYNYHLPATVDTSVDFSKFAVGAV